MKKRCPRCERLDPREDRTKPGRCRCGYRWKPEPPPTLGVRASERIETEDKLR